MMSQKLTKDGSYSSKRKHIKIETEINHTSSEESDSASGDQIPRSDSGSLENSASENDSAQSEDLMKNKGWADSVAKILGTNKPRNKKTLVLSRAKKYSEAVKKEETPSFDVVCEEKPKIEDIKTEAETDSKDAVKKKKLDQPTLRVKPNILEKDREKLLAKIATKGVVQLFNAVKNQQNAFSREMNADGVSESKKEKILKKFDKRTFLDTLMGQTKSVVVEVNTGVKDEVKEESKPKWNVLRDDFMTGAKMKDWDKSSDEE